MTDLDLTGRTALVTGGAQGLGEGMAQALAANGARVVIADVQDDLGAKVADSLKGDGHGFVHLDVTDEASWENATTAAASDFGGLDILVNNAGVGVFRPVADMAVEEWHRIIDTNLSGVFYCCHAALPHLKTHGGWIINIGSLSSTGPFANGAAYCASKAAVDTFSNALMQEVRYDGIRVACVLPGSVNTGFGGRANTKSEWSLQPEDVAEAIVDLIAHPPRSMPSRVEIRPAQPKKA